MKTKMKQRVMSIVLTLIMTLSLLPTNLMGGGTVEVLAASQLTLDGGEVTWDFRDSGFGAYAAAGDWTSDDGILAVTGAISCNGSQHGAAVGNGNVFSINVPAGKTTITVSGCGYGSSSATLEVDGTEVVASQSLGGLETDGKEVKYVYTSAVDTTVDLVVSGSGYIHYIKAKTETDAKLTLDAEAVTWDLRDSGFGAYTGGDSWVADDKILTVTGGISYNGGQHGATVGNGDVFSIKVPAGKTTITVSGCGYGSSSATLEVDGTEVVASQSLGGLETDGKEVKYVYTSAVDTTVDLVVSGNGYIHYIKAKTETDAKLTLDAEAVTWDFRETGFGAYAGGDGWTSDDKILTVTGVLSHNGTQHGANITAGNVFSIKVPAGKTTITALACAYGSAKAKLQVNGVDVSGEQAVGGLTEGQEVEFVYTSDEDVTVDLVITAGGYLHGIQAKTETPPSAAVVSGTVDAAVNGEKLVFKKNGTEVATATIADGQYSVELAVGSSYTVEFKKNALYEVTTGGTIDLTNTAAGAAVSNNITYNALEIPRLTLDAEAVTWNFESNIFGSTSSVEADTMSPDGILTLNGTGMSWNSGGHGLVVGNGSEIAINVPAGQTTVEFTACKYGKTTATASLYIDGAQVSDSVVLYDETDATKRTLICTSDVDTTVVLKVEGSGAGYFRYVTAKTESVAEAATVTGTVDSAVNGQKLLFKKDGATIGSATIAGGAYTVELPIGSEYTVEFENSGTYKVSEGATVDLTETTAGTTVTNNITYVAWDSTKVATVTIGGTTFTIQPGASNADAFVVTAVSGDGSVELATATEGIVWANLGGSGNGVLSSSNVSYGDSTNGSISGNKLTVTFGGNSLPESYILNVKDNSASGVPVKDGKTKSYNLRDGSLISTLWDGKTDATKIKNGTTISSTDKLVTFTGNKGIWYNGTQHGIYINDGDVVTVKVAGNATVDFSLCAYGQADEMLTATASTGNIYLATDNTQNSASMKTASDGGTVSFIYEGDAATLTFTLTGGQSSASYIHSFTVTNEAAETTTNENAVKVKPEILTNIGVAGNLVVTANGQTLNFKQTGGQLQESADKFTKSFTDKGVSFYAFPETADWNKLELEVKVNSIEANSNYNGVFVGAINDSVTDLEAAIATAGIRKLTGLRGIYTKKAEYAGGGQANSTITEGETVKFTMYKSDDNFYIISEWGNGSHTGQYKYNAEDFKTFEANGADSVVYYGLVLAGVNADVTNMVYYDKNGNVLYDQNAYYNPLGEAPVATGATATVAEDRTYITVNWTGSEVYGDGKYVLQVSKDGSDWEDVSDTLTGYSYEYPVGSGESGNFKFRVCGTLGNSDEQSVNNRNTYVESNEVYVKAALAAPVISLNVTSPADKVSLSWTASAGATSYEVYRRSADETEATVIATVTTTSYVDTNVTAEVPYYYYVVAKSADNFSNPQEEVWTLPTAGHTGEYQYDDAVIAITKKSYDTVFTNKVTVEGLVTAPGEVSLEVNGNVVATTVVESANDTFSFTDVTIEEGRNDVVVYLKYDGGDKTTRKALNFVYLTNYDYVVNADFTGTAGDTTEYGVPQYATIGEAIDAIGTSNSSRKVIFIKEGSYEERLEVSTPYISLIGEDSKKTIIHNYPADFIDTGYRGGSMGDRAAMRVNTGATGFSLENLTVQNDWEYIGDGSISNESADVLHSEAEGAMYVNIRLLGYQDTLCANKNHQYYYKCYIAGNVDFIYGNSGMALFNDCDIVFRYNENKNSGYVTAMKNDSSQPYGALFNECRITSESGCSGTKYYLGRPWGEQAATAFVDCYMSGVINRNVGWTTWGGKDFSTDEAAFAKVRYYEHGSYGAGYAVTKYRRQLSDNQAAAMLTTGGLGWDPYGSIVTVSDDFYVGDMTTAANDKVVEEEYNSDVYSPYEGDDTGLGKYNLEGYAQSELTTGGGLLKETNSNYYAVTTAEEFLDALLTIQERGTASVIEIQADLNLGNLEIKDASKYSSILVAHNEPLTHPELLKTGVSRIILKEYNDLTIFSSNGSSINHASFDIQKSNNIIIRNIVFDELWEWDEKDAGNYDTNDWDFIVIQNGSDRVWIDHCTFYKAYDGIVDVKTNTTSNNSNITVSWCEFLPGSENNTFFNAMMDTMSANPNKYPYYESLLESGMTKEQIWWYAYGQKKTHLLGQSDSAVENTALRVTLANNYYFNSMDRMPRLRYGNAHVYNCIMDAQELYDARHSITNENAAKHIVSNGASSTCGGQLLVENSYINGIMNALNSGNGSSPAGWINATNSLYYISGTRYALTPKVNTTLEGEEVLLLDADKFVEELPYEGYALYDAAELSSVVQPYAGANRLNLTNLQWEKTEYKDETWEVPEDDSDYDNEELPDFIVTDDDVTVIVEGVDVEIPEDVTFRDSEGNIIEDGKVFLNAVVVENSPLKGKIKIGSDAKVQYYEVTLTDELGNKVTIASGKIKIIFAYPEGTNKDDYSFRVYHGLDDGDVEKLSTKRIKEGIRVKVDSLSPFAIVYEIDEYEEGDGTSVPTGDNTPLGLLLVMMLASAGVCGVYFFKKKENA